MSTGFVERQKGKSITSKDSQQQMGTGGAVFKGGGNIYVNAPASPIGTVGTTSATLDSYSLPGNSLYGNNYMLTIAAFGNLAANANSKVVKLVFGSEIVSFTNATSVTGGQPWMLQLQVFKTGASAQFVTSQQIIGTSHGGITEQTVSAAETDTAAISISVQASGTSNNDVQLYGWYVEANNF